MITGYITYKGTQKLHKRLVIKDDYLRKTTYFCKLPISMVNHLSEFTDTCLSLTL